MTRKLAQPTKDALREQLRLAAQRIIELEAQVDRLRWWKFITRGWK